MMVDNPLQPSIVQLPPLQQEQHHHQQQQDQIDSSYADDFNGPPATMAQAPPTPPPFLPLTTFAPQDCRVLARRHTHIPIMVIATEAANKVAWKNDLQLVDMFQGIVEDLRPSSTQQGMAPFRSINRSLIPTDIKVRFVEPSQMDPLPYGRAHDMLDDNARLQTVDGDLAQDLVLLEDRVDELLQDKRRDEGLEDATRDAYQLTSPLDIPWLIRYRHALDVSTDSLPHDLINCPPLALLVCTTDEIERPELVLQELYNSPHVLPDAYKRGVYDPNGMRHEVLVLHDAVDGPPNVDDDSLRQSLQKRFGSNSAILRINSMLPETAIALADQEETDLWGGDGRLGNFLSLNDRVLLRRYFQSLLTTSLLPALERRIADLNAIVNERKKGVRNLVKSFWRKPKDETTPATAPGSTHGPSGGDRGGGDGDGGEEVKYRYDSVESQTRLLADTLFLVQDYDAALSTYRLIRDDYKSDRALSYYANVQEMIALCMYRLDPYTRGKEIFSHLETALLSYTRAAEEDRSRMNNANASSTAGSSSFRPAAAPHPTRLATRLCLILAAASDTLTKGREIEVADLLAATSSHESSLGAAVLLEQASSFFYNAKLYRKYAFHMLMSGHMFRTAGQDHHAFRCFTSALYVYRNGGWIESHNHLRTALAAQLFSMERYSIALVLYARLVGSTGGGKVSSKSQQKFLQHLLQICEDHRKHALAGADKMSSPPTIVNHQERETFRKDQLGQIVNIIRYTMGATRVLELPYVNLPRIDDSSIKIWTANDTDLLHLDDHHNPNRLGGGVGATPPSSSLSEELLGKPGKGQDEVWDELELTALAELHAVDDTKPQLDDTVTAALAKISNLKHRRVIAEIDKEKQNRTLIERSRKNGSKTTKPAVRSRGEPIFCEFRMTNPLGVDVLFTQIQLVVSMVERQSSGGDGGGRTCTNQFAIQLKDEKGGYPMEWTFASSGNGLKFSLPEFCRISEPSSKACRSANGNPFFVVTKQQVELPPAGEATVSLGLTPLVEGDLEILGVRCKLSDKVWLYHPFNIPGPLLRDTRTNIMNRVRGQSTLLKSKIECDMPCLSAELVKRMSTSDATPVPSDGGPLLDGQISSWTIRLTNVGTAPATNVTLKTNLPWVNIMDNKANRTSSEIEAQPTSRCIGPSGTLMVLPLVDRDLKQAGTIQPGESMDIPIQIRTSGNKKRDFYMLYRYELTRKHDADKKEKARSRWLRRMYEVSAYPSLSFDAKILTTTWKGKDILLSVEFTNNRLDRPTDLFITLDKLSLVSRYYRIEPLPGQFVTNASFGNVLQIGWQERITVHCRVLPLEAGSSTCLLIECPFAEDGSSVTRECASSEIADYLCLEQAFESFEVRVRSTWQFSL